MWNARIIPIRSMREAVEEVKKINVHSAAVEMLAVKALHLCIKLEHVTPFAANILKQEMLGKGGDAAVSKGVADFKDEYSDVLLMGTAAQLRRLLAKLEIQKGSLAEIGKEVGTVLAHALSKEPRAFHCRGYDLPLGRKTYVMGILNVTPDSFSDGGSYADVGEAVDRACQMIEDGADIIDIGGESSRPGYAPVPAEEEAARVLPVIHRLKTEVNIPVSIDTMKAGVARQALEAGADIVNDIWGFQRDANMACTAAAYDAGVVLMHNQNGTAYRDLMGDMLAFLRESIRLAKDAGLPDANLSVDPGIGFGKDLAQNIESMRRLEELQALGYPVLLGTSRKSLIGKTLNLPVDERVEGTAATVAFGIERGVDFVRVHDVKEMARVCKMTDALVRTPEGSHG